jgi:cysteine desulfurase
MSQRRSVYLDYSATTPMDVRVVEAMMPYFDTHFGNASSAHAAGRRAEQAVEDARATIARLLNCKPSEVIFTSGGTESDNLAIRGAAWGRRSYGEHLITTPIEHSAVSRTVEQLAQLMGFTSSILPVDGTAMVDVEDFASSITERTTVASVMYVNNEVGTIEPIPALAEIAHQHGVLFHTDAVQAAGQLTLDVAALGVDMLSISAHKFYGPKGVGALYVREGIDLVPSQTGGSHENFRRAGTSNTAGIVGMAKALELAYEELDVRSAHYQTLRDKLVDGIQSRIPGTHLTGHPEQRLPSHASFVFDGIDGNALIMHLDLKGVSASSASACKTGNPEPSSVLLAMGYPRALAGNSLRLTIGKDTSEEDVDYVVDTLCVVIERLRQLQRNSG